MAYPASYEGQKFYVVSPDRRWAVHCTLTKGQAVGTITDLQTGQVLRSFRTMVTDSWGRYQCVRFQIRGQHQSFNLQIPPE